MTDRQPMRPVNDNDRLHTLEEVAQAIGVTRERARQIEAQALRKLRYALEQRGIGEREWLDHLHSLRARDGWTF